MDDEPDLLRLFARHFGRRFEVCTASGGAQALQAVVQEPAFDVIVADMAMPRMTGVQLLERMRSISPDTVRLLWTGQADLAVATQAVNRGHVFKFVTKPCRLEELELYVWEAVREGERQRRGASSPDPSLRVLASGGEIGRAAAVRPLHPGTLVLNRYLVEDAIGRGGSASVYRAKDLVLGEDVALKVFHGAEIGRLDPRIKRELSLCRNLAHPNVARLYEIGAYGVVPFLSMELLRGRDLRGAIDEGVSLEDALSYLIQACAGVGHAHQAGAVHRDIKPENLFVCEGGQLKVMDFGLAKYATGGTLTEPGTVAGTLGYMAPEQLRGLTQVDQRTDVYALGAVGYELVTGRTPFSSDTVQGLVAMTLFESPPDPGTLAHLPDGLSEVLMTCLARDPAERFQNMAALAAALQRVRARAFPQAM